MRASSTGLQFFGAIAWLLVWMLPGRGADTPTVTAPTTILTPQAIAASIVHAQQQAAAAEAHHDETALVAALNDEADGQLRAHQFDLAEKLRLRVLRLQEERFGKSSVQVSDALLNLGWFYGNLARYEEAQQALDRALEIRQRALGQETAPVAEVLNALGALEDNRGNLDLAEAFYQQAIEIREKVLGLQSPVTAATWNNLATLYWVTGEYAAADKLFAQALAVREKVLGPNSALVATTLNNMALLDCSLGDYDEAESYFQRALRIRTARLGPDHPLTVTTISQLGQLYVREGNDARAEPLLVRALEMQRKTYPVDHPDLARSLSQLGLLYDRLGQYAQAEPLLKQALGIRLRTLGVEHHEYAESLAALARHDHAQGRLADALPLYDQALRIDTQALGKDHPDTVAIAADLAYLKLDLGKKEDAIGLVNDVTEAQQNALNSVFAFTAERQRMDFERTVEPCDLPAALGDADLLAQVVLRTKGVVLDSLLEDDAMNRAERDPEAQALMEKKRLLSAQILRAQEDPNGVFFSNSPEAVAERQRMAAEEQDLEASLAKKGIGSGKMRRALEAEVSDLRDALPADTVLVEFVAYDQYKGNLSYEPAYGAVVISRSAPCQWIPLGPRAAIDARIKLYQKYMRRRMRESVLAEVLHGLYASLCQPVAAAFPDGTKRVILSPDANLNFVSFATLLDGADHFWAEDFTLNYVSSGRDLLEEQQGLPLHRQMVIFANPDFNHATGHRARLASGEDDLLAPLPGTEREAAFLQVVAQDNQMDVHVYRGAEASKQNLAKQDSPYVLHLATHGLYLSPDDLPNLPASPDASRTLTPGDQAMGRSLLALAGADLTLSAWKKGFYPSPENDGLLTAQEVAGLNLDHTWLVTLSACDTGSGEAQAGEGVLGLRRGFAEAGAQNVLMTLWTVDDAETVELMQAFYRQALQSGNAPAALAEVQRASLQDLRKKSGLAEAVRKAGPFILSY